MSNRVIEAFVQNCFTQSNPTVFKFLHNFKHISVNKTVPLKFQPKLIVMFMLFMHQNPRDDNHISKFNAKCELPRQLIYPQYFLYCQ
jgi:hypothetical protein